MLSGDVPPVLSSAAIWSPIPKQKEIGREFVDAELRYGEMYPPLRPE
jgi:hypothetical protein